MFKLYSSSAGSGKTYTLTKEYLKLILNGESDTYFRHVLAVTFTNAAAAEMKERILGMLQLFASGEGDEHPMFTDIIEELYPEVLKDDELLEKKKKSLTQHAGRLFTRILHSYSDFAVLTIDKFTKRIVSSFTDELGLPYNFQTEVDSQLLEEAVNRLLARVGRQGEEALTVVLEAYFRENATEGKGWSALQHRLQEAAQDLLNEGTNEALARVEYLTIQDWLTLRKNIRSFIQQQENALLAIGQQAMELLDQAGLTPKDFFQGARGIYGYFEKLSKGQKLWDLPGSYATQTLEDTTKWCASKVSQDVRARVEALQSDLIALAEEHRSLLDKYKSRYLTYQSLYPHLYNTSLLEEIRKEFRELLRNENQVHISEFNERIAKIVMSEPVPLIFERLGEKYHHILIDEFQDTSKLQFLNLLPLIENALAYNYFNLVVGDAKQAIYRFRGGDMDLIVHLANNQFEELFRLLGEREFLDERLFPLYQSMDKANLRTNRRSFKEITTFNNDFFSYITKTLAHESETLGLVFDEDFQQEIAPQAPVGGHVEINFLEKGQVINDVLQDPMIERTLSIVKELQQQGYRWKDFAVLTRNKREASQLAIAFKESAIPLISEDSLLVSYAISVKFLVAMIKVISVKDGMSARYSAIWWFYQLKFQVPPSTTEEQQIRELCQRTDIGYFIAFFKEKGYDIRSLFEKQPGIYELCEQINGIFDLYAQGGEREYLLRFMDIVLEFMTSKNNNPSDFLIRWESVRNKVSIALPQGANAVRFTTIHKSKGLEYPIVIVPYCNWSYRVRPGGTLWVDLLEHDYPELVIENEEKGPAKLQVGKVSFKSDLDQTDLSVQARDERERTLIENLNILYVAFTRPVQRLYILSQLPKKWEEDRIFKLLYEFLNRSEQTLWEEGKLNYIVSEGVVQVPNQQRTSEPVTEIVMDTIVSHGITTTLAVQSTK